MESMHYFVSGILLGFAAGISPGPLLALVISETLIHSRKEGVLVSVAPVLTDVPIIGASVFILSGISHSDFLLGLISLAGSSFLASLAYRNIMIRDVHPRLRSVKPQSLRKGVITNFLSPHPYLFWLTIGSPIILKACRTGKFSALSFIAGFYILLIGSKILIALLVNRSKKFLKSRTYLYVIRATGIILAIFAVLFFKNGLVMLGLI
jgi:threonine/homoserine/homoserine lactone efflux protein